MTVVDIWLSQHLFSLSSSASVFFWISSPQLHIALWELDVMGHSLLCLRGALGPEWSITCALLLAFVTFSKNKHVPKTRLIFLKIWYVSPWDGAEEQKERSHFLLDDKLYWKYKLGLIEVMFFASSVKEVWGQCVKKQRKRCDGRLKTWN